MPNLRFGGSVWCNIDVALRHVTAVYEQELEPLGLNVLEWYLVRFLYEQDGQMATHLANAVGRPATSFTPILDKLETKGFVERRAHPADRRAIRVYLTKEGRALKEQVKAAAESIETKLRQRFADKEWQSYESVVAHLQGMTL